MGQFVESAQPQGPEFILQDHERAAPVQFRSMLKAGRRVGRDKYGAYLIDPASYGDLNCALVWPRDTRPMPMWSWGYAVVTGSKKGPITAPGGLRPPGDPTSTARPPLVDEYGSDPEVLPVRDDDWFGDQRMQVVEPVRPKGWPEFPDGTTGVVLAGTEEKAQHYLFHPTDPRLIAPHTNGRGQMASLVCDIGRNDREIDTRRQGRLSSMVRVIRRPSNSPDARNALAWNITLSGQGDVRGGYVADRAGANHTAYQVVSASGRAQLLLGSPNAFYDSRSNSILRFRVYDPLTGGYKWRNPGGGPIKMDPRAARLFLKMVGLGGGRDSVRTVTGPVRTPESGGGGGIVLGMASSHDGGPFDVGGYDDKHRIGYDEDGNPINPLHLSTDAYWRMDSDRDGPMLFETTYKDGTEFEQITLVHLAWDEDTQYWRWWTTSPLEESDDPPPPPPYPKDPPTPTDPPRPPGPPDAPPYRRPPRRNPQGPGTPAPGSPGEGIVPSVDVGYQPRTVQDQAGLRHPTLTTPREVKLTSMSFRPQPVWEGARDLRYHSTKLDPDLRRHHRDTVPTVARLEAFGGHPDSEVWEYTLKPGEGRERAGTGPGGLVFGPPEVAMGQTEVKQRSSVHFVIADGADLAFADPDVSTGGVKDGHTLEREGTSLKVSEVDSAGARVESGRLEAGDLLMTWAGNHQDGRTYYPGQVVLDEGWTMVARRETEDRAAPTPTGPKEWVSGLGDTPLWTDLTDVVGMVVSGQRYTIAQPSYITGARVWVEAVDPDIEYQAWIIHDPLGEPDAEQIHFEPTTVGWQTIQTHPRIVLPGTVIDFLLVQVSHVTPSQFSYDWDYKRSNGTPPPKEAWHQNNGQILRFHQNDVTETNRSADLDTVSVGDQIQSQGIAWTITSVNKAGSVYEFGVTPNSRIPTEGQYSFLFTTFSAKAIEHVRIVDHFAADPNVEGLFGLDVDLGDLLPDQNAYGVDFLRQDALVSDDWEVVSPATT